jgi:isoleucyl-tRNA synthetase
MRRLTMYKKVSTDMSFVQREKKYGFLESRKISSKNQLMPEKTARPFTFYDGPPTANGKHI